ncbi:hypothetical protein SAMN06295967_1163 [Belliella buryatensis]|uniref:Uncharacterized protein n=1 Tax=Belliella buryatensis TaxID=1500549 RepID=A0A239GGV8_9BACT|nr:hypothetical protein SAMN06295967_1163 [Belliella buryatensis]
MLLGLERITNNSNEFKSNYPFILNHPIRCDHAISKLVAITFQLSNFPHKFLPTIIYISRFSLILSHAMDGQLRYT